MVAAEDIQKRQLLKALKEPLRSSFALLDFSTVPFTEVVNWVLNLDHEQCCVRPSGGTKH
jgi:hypothetical protein